MPLLLVDRSRRACTAGAAPLLALMLVLGVAALRPSPARAFNPVKPICKVAALRSGAVGKLCGLASSPGKLLKAGGKLLTGHLGGAINTVFGGGGAGSATATAVGLAAIGVWVLGGAKFALHETARVLGRTTSPQLQTTWFSSAYWRMAAVAALLTLPFLFAAGVQALIHGDLALLARAAFGYLPLALLAVGIAAPLTMLLLAAADQLSAIVAAAAGHQSTNFLVHAGTVVGVLSVFKGSPFLAFLVGLIAAAGALVLWLELLMREAAVYIVVLMLPLAFAAMVWPARKIWAVRAVEVLVALILAKFAIVAVLALGGAALGGGGAGITGALAGAVLVLLGAFAPWALLRLLPLTELASGAAGALRASGRLPVGISAEEPGQLTGPAAGWAGSLTAAMRRQADDVDLAASAAAGGDISREAPSQPDDLLATPGNPHEPANQEPAPVLVGVGAAGDSPADGTANAELADEGPSPASDAAAQAGVPTGAATCPIGRPQGLDPMFYAPDFSWRPLELGEWPIAPLWPWPPEQGGPNEIDGGAQADTASTAEDHDPLPPPQSSGTGGAQPQLGPPPQPSDMPDDPGRSPDDPGPPQPPGR